MNDGSQSHMMQSKTVKKQLDRLEEQTAKNDRNKKGSTNEIQPMETEDGLTQ